MSSSGRRGSVMGCSINGTSYLLAPLLKSILLPLLLTHLIVRQFNLHPLIVFIYYLSSLPLLYILRTQWSVFQHDRAARRAGAMPIPRVRGRFPLNVDILLDWARSGSEEEVGRMMVLLGRKYGRTYNTRVLGEDQVGHSPGGTLFTESEPRQR